MRNHVHASVEVSQSRLSTLQNSFCHCPQTLLKMVLMPCSEHIWHPEMEGFLFHGASRSGNSFWPFYAKCFRFLSYYFCCLVFIFLLVFSLSLFLVHCYYSYQHCLSSSFVYRGICALASLSAVLQVFNIYYVYLHVLNLPDEAEWGSLSAY